MVCHEGCDLSGKIQKDFWGGISKSSIKQSTNAFIKFPPCKGTSVKISHEIAINLPQMF